MYTGNQAGYQIRAVQTKRHGYVSIGFETDDFEILALLIQNERCIVIFFRAQAESQVGLILTQTYPRELY